MNETIENLKQDIYDLRLTLNMKQNNLPSLRRLAVIYPFLQETILNDERDLIEIHKEIFAIQDKISYLEER